MRPSISDLEPTGEADNVTTLLNAWSQGEPEAGDTLMPKVLEELRRMARGFLRRERRNHTLQPTALVHEAYLRLVAQKEQGWRNRGHFYAMAATMMRRVLVDHARHHTASKRGSGLQHLSLEEAGDLAQENPVDLLALDRALSELASFDPRRATIVELRFFVGLRLEEIADALDCAPATVTRQWLAAKAWLYRELEQEFGP